MYLLGVCNVYVYRCDCRVYAQYHIDLSSCCISKNNYYFFFFENGLLDKIRSNLFYSCMKDKIMHHNISYMFTVY